MALSFIESEITQKTKGVLIHEKWMEDIDKEIAFQVEYAHTIRKATVIVETKSSNKQDEKYKKYTIFTWNKTGSKPTATFTAGETFWSNRVRKKALMEGIQNYIPKALYLMRPETAYVACMHYLAKELGGAKDYTQQRMFIFNNPGIQHCMTDFWAKVQEIHWSGGMSPGLTENEKHGLICALIECYCYSQKDSENQIPCLPVPHLQVEMLRKIGVHIPPLEGEEDDLTDAALEIVKKDLNRTNLPGIPTMLTAHIQCDACVVAFENQQQLKEHRRTEKCKELTTCNGCAIKFKTNTDYMVHRISFCRQGPLTGNKCPVCNVPGPRCLCQMHWKRTYDMISQLWENDHNETAWLTKDPAYSAVLQMAKPFLNVNLVEEPEQQPTKPLSPTALKPTEWEKQKRLIPTQYFTEEDDKPKIKMSKDTYMDLNQLVVEIQKHHKLTINMIATPKPVPSPPKSIKKELVTTQQHYNRLLKIATSNPKEATITEIEGVESQVTELVRVAKDDKTTKEMAEKLEVDSASLQESLVTLEDWVAKAKLNYKETEAKDLAQNIFSVCSKSGQSSIEDLSIQTELAKEYSFEGLILNQKISQKKVEDNTRKLKNIQLKDAHNNEEGDMAETSRRQLFREWRNNGRSSRSRSKSREHKENGKQSPTASVASSIRGGSKTHTMLMSLERAMGLLKSVEPNFRSTTFKRHYNSTKDFISKAESHLRDDPEDTIDPAYTDDLLEQLTEAENLLERVDERADDLEQLRQQEQQDKSDIRKALPKSKPQRWCGDINGFSQFKIAVSQYQKYYVEDRQAFNAMLDLVDDKSLRKQLSLCKTTKEALDTLELRFGKPELAGPKIKVDMMAVKDAYNEERECEVIITLKQHYQELTQINQQHLIGKNEVLTLCHKLRSREGMDILKKIHPMTDPELIRKTFFEELDSQYTLNTIWERTLQEKDKRPSYKDNTAKKFQRTGDKKQFSTSRRTDTAKTPEISCSLCKKSHKTYLCKKLAQADKAMIKGHGLCLGCLRKEHGPDPRCGILKYKNKETGQAETKSLKCPDCGYHKELKKLHEKCKPVHNYKDSQPKEVYTSAGTAAASGTTTNRRTQVIGPREFAWRGDPGVLLNTTPMNASLELIDIMTIQAPDGEIRRCRVIHDQYGATDSLADSSLVRYSHAKVKGGINITMNTSTGMDRLSTDEIVLKVLLPGGKEVMINAIKTDMRSKRAFTILQKTIDVPTEWNEKHFQNRAKVGHGYLRITNYTDLPEVTILLGANNNALAPREVDRFSDGAGCVTLYKSHLQSEQWLFGGGRIVGQGVPVPIGGTHQRMFHLTGEYCEVSIRRTNTEKDEPSILFPANPTTVMSKLDKRFFKYFSDSDLLIPHPRACKGCSQCPKCSDVAAVEKRAAQEEALDNLCTLNTSKGWDEGGGWNIKLLWNDRKSDVPLNKEDSIRRFLATERALLKEPKALKTFNAQIEKCLKLGYFCLEKENKVSLDHLQVSFLPLSYALKDTVELEDDGSQRTKARPVSDGSHKGCVTAPSVNDALVQIPDLWTDKIQNLMIKFRTAKRLGLADISQYYHRLHLDPTSISMTRVIWREGGAGAELKKNTSINQHQEAQPRDLITMLVPSASMGLGPVPGLASHCRARTADLIKDEEAKIAIQKSYVDDVFQPTLWKSRDGPTEPDGKLIERIKETTTALGKAHLTLGEGWMTDLSQECIPKGDCDIKGVSDEQIQRDLGVSSTGALGLRWNLGGQLPEGGTFSYRVHRPGSINLLPKKRGKRPEHGELKNRTEIHDFLQTHGLTKAALLALVMNLFDPLGVCAPWTCTAKLLYRQVLTESPSLDWKSIIPQRYNKQVEDLACDLLVVSQTQQFPRRAIQPGPDGTVGHCTLIITHDASCESGCCLAYVHQQWPEETAVLPSVVTGKKETPVTGISTRVTLLCGSHKLTETGHHEQVAGELLSATMAVKLKKLVVEQSLLQFDRIIYLGDSLTVARALRKSDRAYSPWAAARVSYIQRNEDLSVMFHVPGKFLLGTADKGTRSHVKPSVLLDKAYWEGKGNLDCPLHELPITDPTTYSITGLETLPRAWINKAVVNLQPASLRSAEIVCQRIDMETEEHWLHLAEKFRSYHKLIRIMMNVLKWSPNYKEARADELWEAAEKAWIQFEYNAVKTGLKKKPLPLTLLSREQVEERTFHALGRHGYKVPILPSPKDSALTRTLLKWYHDNNHVSSPAKIQAIIGRRFYLLGGVPAYLKKLRERCTKCKLLAAQPSSAMAGESPEGTQGPLVTDESMWRRWMLDIAGPIYLTPWAGKKKTRRGGKTLTTLKHWILLSVDLGSRQIDACMLEGYSSDSVLTGLRELMARHGTPLQIYWDRASNLHAAGALLKNEQDEDINGITRSAQILIQEEIKRKFEANGVTVNLSIPYSSHRQGRVEAAVKQLKKKLSQLLYNEAETRLTPLEATSALSTACSLLNQRPLILTAESTLEEKQILCPAYLTCSDLDLQNTSCPGDPKTWRRFAAHQSTLTQRASMVQERIEKFKKTFDTFMTRHLVSLGHFNKDHNKMSEGDVVLILDKKKPTLPVQSSTRYRLGVVEEEISPRSFKVRYAQHSQIGKINITTCERSIQGLSLIVRKADFNPTENDFFLDPVFPPGNLIQELQPAKRNVGYTDSKENEGCKLATEEEKPSSSQRGKVTLKIDNKPTDGWIQDMIPRRRP